MKFPRRYSDRGSPDRMHFATASFGPSTLLTGGAGHDPSVPVVRALEETPWYRVVLHRVRRAWLWEHVGVPDSPAASQTSAESAGVRYATSQAVSSLRSSQGSDPRLVGVLRRGSLDFRLRLAPASRLVDAGIGKENAIACRQPVCRHAPAPPRRVNGQRKHPSPSESRQAGHGHVRSNDVPVRCERPGR
jgi:hypothetical protein